MVPVKWKPIRWYHGLKWRSHTLHYYDYHFVIQGCQLCQRSNRKYIPHKGSKGFITWTASLAATFQKKNGPLCFGFLKNNSGITWQYTHEPIQWVNTRTKRWGDPTVCMIHVTSKTYEEKKKKKSAHTTENKKVNILAEFETSARQLPHQVSSHTKIYIWPYLDALLNVNGRTSGALENL